MSQTAAAVRVAPFVVSASIESLGQRIAAEFAEMPGMSLTAAQARVLFNIPEPTCTTVLNTLVGSHVLRRCPDGRYRRGDVGV